MTQQNQQEEYNQWSKHTVSELWDALFEAEQRLDNLQDEPINYYSAGYSDTYLSAMSQVWGIQGCKDDIVAIKAAISRHKEVADEMVESTIGDKDF